MVVVTNLPSDRYRGKSQVEIWREFLSDVNPLLLKPQAFALYQLMMSKIDEYDRFVSRNEGVDLIPEVSASPGLSVPRSTPSLEK